MSDTWKFGFYNVIRHGKKAMAYVKRMVVRRMLNLKADFVESLKSFCGAAAVSFYGFKGETGLYTTLNGRVGTQN